MRLLDLLFGFRLAFLLIEVGMTYALVRVAFRFMFTSKWFEGKNNERFVTGVWLFAIGALQMNLINMGSSITAYNWQMEYAWASIISIAGITEMGLGFFLIFTAWYGAVSDLNPKLVFLIWGPIILTTIVMGSLLSWATHAFVVFPG